MFIPFFLFSGFLKAPPLAPRVVTPIYHVEKPSSMRLLKDLYGESKKDLKIMDFGCGSGLSGQVLKDKYGYDNLTGLDVSEDMLNIARQRNIYKTLISAFVGTDRIKEIQDGEYDAVISSGVFQTGHVRANALDEITRWIKPGNLSLL